MSEKPLDWKYCLGKHCPTTRYTTLAKRVTTEKTTTTKSQTTTRSHQVSCRLVSKYRVANYPDLDWTTPCFFWDVYRLHKIFENSGWDVNAHNIYEELNELTSSVF